MVVWSSLRAGSVEIKVYSSHSLPGITCQRYTPFRTMCGGGLICYGPDSVDQYRRAGRYVDRILKGVKPGELPVQSPIKYILTINLKTAKSLGLDVPSALLARAEEVIE